MEALKTVRQLAKELLALLDGETDPAKAVFHVRNACRREVIAPMVRCILEHNPDNPSLPPNRPRNHYAIHPDWLEKIRLHMA